MISPLDYRNNEASIDAELLVYLDEGLPRAHGGAGAAVAG